MEYLDIVDKNDKVLGKIERNKAHEKHILHRAVHILIFNDKNQVLLQLRSKIKKQYPGYWMGSVGGHVSAGKKPDLVAKKELKEELGIDVPLKFIGKFITRDEHDDENVYAYVGKSNGPFVKDNSETSKIKFFHYLKLLKEVNKLKATPHLKSILKLSKKKLFSK